MASVEVTKWNKVLTVTNENIIELQIMLHCYFKRIHISPADLSCLTLIGKSGKKVGLTSFCILLADKGIFKSEQSCRNAISKLVDKGLIAKDGFGKKTIGISDDVQLQTEGNILVDLKCFSKHGS